MDDHSVLSALLDVQDLPTLPVIVSQVMEITADENSSAEDLTRLLETDHAISARVLRLANSAFYGQPHHVSSVRQGVMLLGFNQTRYLALATSVFDIFSKGPQTAFDPEDFWMHSFGTAKAVQILTEKYCQKAAQEGTFTAGLLHDIGKYVLACRFREEYNRILQKAAETGKPLIEVEQERLGVTHTQVGYWLTEKWKFPRLIGAVIGRLYQARTYSGPHQMVVAAVAVANLVSIHAKMGTAGDSPSMPVDLDLLVLLDLSREKFNELVKELAALREDTRAFLRQLKSAV